MRRGARTISLAPSARPRKCKLAFEDQEIGVGKLAGNSLGAGTVNLPRACVARTSELSLCLLCPADSDLHAGDTSRP